jgi:hypothetical protein
MRWITGEKATVDRLACSWLIRRVLDLKPPSKFRSENTDWAKVTAGILFAVPGCELGRRGEKISFDSVLGKFRLNDPALLLLAEFVRAADLDPGNLQAFTHRLQSIDGGFSKRRLPDKRFLIRQFAIYDALYAECKARSASQGTR